MSNRFKRFSGMFKCRYCRRNTRDTNGDNGDLRLCEDCEQGLMWENGGNDTSDPAEKAQCFARADAYFQAAIDKGGVIPDFGKR